MDPPARRRRAAMGTAAERAGVDGERQQPAAPGSAALFAAASDEADYPRGGRSFLSQDEVAEARVEANDGVEREGKKRKKRKRKKGKAGNHNGALVNRTAEPSASVLPLQVSLDESKCSGLDDNSTKGHEIGNETEANAKKSDKRLKKEGRKQRELEISAVEERALQGDIMRTPDDFEKLVRSSPNSSFVWIKYMACLLDLADVEKASAVAERALKTINPREEQERLNVWVAYCNLENEYGSPREDAVKKVFQRALQYCDHKKLHLALLEVYERTEQYQLADELLDRVTKRFKASCKIWLCRIQLALKQGKNVEFIEAVVNHALQSLPRRKRIKFLPQTGTLEFQCGVPEEGRSRFELILREHPKRTDLWSVYLDQEIRLGDIDVIRGLFDRATCLTLPPKMMQFLFKKYLKFEKSLGEDNKRIQYVQQKAMEYVESSLPSQKPSLNFSGCHHW